MTTLENSYCRPKTEEEWKMLTMVKMHPKDTIVFKWGGEVISAGDSFVFNRTEIPVQYFTDLLEDRITPWRLEEVGFEEVFKSYYKLYLPHDKVVVEMYPIEMQEQFGMFQVLNKGTNYRGIKTFTDLLTLIRFLTP